MTAAPWREVELTLTASVDVPDPYTSVEAWADFTHDDGTLLRRPAFYDGGRTWRVRFAGTQGGTGTGAPPPLSTTPVSPA